jgi:hypothetical protein
MTAAPAPVQHNNLLELDHQTFVRDIVDSTDPIERQLSRQAYRVRGAILGATFAGGMIGGASLADTFVDWKKIAAIQSRLTQLENIVAATEIEKSQLSIQKHIYSNIKNYTDRAQMIKCITGISYGIAGIAMIYALVAQSNFSAEVGYQLGTLGLASFAISLLHRYTTGSQLQAANREVVLGNAIVYYP